jgi:acyl-CoA synthetase (AMP-forming)/AMP-acid ligase II
MFALAADLAGQLRALSLPLGAPVALATPDVLLWVAGFVATTSMGLAPVLIDPSGPEPYLPLLAHLGCNVAVGLADVTSPLRVTYSISPRPASDRAALPLVPLSGDDLAVIASTSGSTGRPKGVLISHDALTSGLKTMLLGGALLNGLAKSSGANSGDQRAGPPATLITAPLFHVGGYSPLLLTFLMGGRSVVLGPGREGRLAAQIHAHGVRSVGGVTPFLLSQLVSAAENGVGLDALNSITLQGAAFSSGLIEKAKRALRNARFSGSYGMTETNGAVAVATEFDLLERPGWYRTLPSAEFSTSSIGSVGADVEKIGRIHVRGPMVAQGYADGAPWTHGFDTGDLGRLDEAGGGLQVIDRVANCAWISGRLISTAMIEAVAYDVGGFMHATATFDDIGHGCLRLVPRPGEAAPLNEVRLRIARDLPEMAERLTVEADVEVALTATGKFKQSPRQIQTER